MGASRGTPLHGTRGAFDVDTSEAAARHASDIEDGSFIYHNDPSAIPPQELGELTDVDTSGVADGNPIVYNSGTGFWEIRQVVLPAGTVDAPPLRLQEGTLVSPVEAGAIEFTDSTFWGTAYTTRRAFSLASGSLTTPVVVTNTTSEETLFTGSIVANDFRVGRVYRVTACGLVSTVNASQTLTVRVYVGTSLVATGVFSPALLTNEGWSITGHFTVRSLGATGAISPSMIITIVDTQQYVEDEVEVDTTVAEDIVLTIEWSTADIGNIFTITQGYLEVLI